MKGFIIKDGFFRLGDDKETAHARIKRLITTPLNSAYGYLDYGSRVLEYFYLGNTEENVQGMVSEVKMLIASYEKGINLQTVYASVSTPANSASDKLEVQIEFDLGGSREKTVIIENKNGGEN